MTGKRVALFFVAVIVWRIADEIFVSFRNSRAAA